jgi:DNA (cytosine-5)-methyltransferase 1
MRVGSLFSGIGGFDLGLERAGYEIVWQVENDAYCRRVLAKHWPDVPCYGDIHDVGAHNLEEVDVICGGFPCQPVSTAGKQRGQDDERWLWPEFARILRELRPRYALVENVPGLLVRGMGDVLRDLAAAGYDAEWGRVSAASVGAPHLRKRVFLIAHLRGASSGVPDAVEHKVRHIRQRDGQQYNLSRASVAGHDGEEGVVADAEKQSKRPRLCESEPGRQRGRRSSNSRGSPGDVADAEGERRSREVFTQSHMVYNRPESTHSDAGTRGNEEWWAVEPNVGRVAHGVPARVDRLRALGNAIVPQVAEWIGRRLTSFTTGKGRDRARPETD